MSFISLFFIAFFPVVAFIYYILPQKYRNLWLLATSYYAYYRWNNSFVLLLLFITLISYLGAIVTKKRKGLLALNIIITLAPLMFYKYDVMFLDFNTPELVEAAGLEITKDVAGDLRHANISGAEKETRYLGYILSDLLN